MSVHIEVKDVTTLGFEFPKTKFEDHLETHLTPKSKSGVITAQSRYMMQYLMMGGCPVLCQSLSLLKMRIQQLGGFQTSARLMKRTKPLIVALPNVEDNLLLLFNSKYFSSLDFSQGYFHLEVHPGSLKYLYGACPNYFICYQKKELRAQKCGSILHGG